MKSSVLEKQDIFFNTRLNRTNLSVGYFPGRSSIIPSTVNFYIYMNNMCPAETPPSLTCFTPNELVKEMRESVDMRNLYSKVEFF